MRKSLYVVILVLMIIAIGFVGCGQTSTLPEGIPVADITETWIPGFENIRATATNREIFFPMNLRCEDIQLDEIRPGYTWKNLQIGVTRFEEMVEILELEKGGVYVEWSESTGYVSFYYTPDQTIPWALSACFIGDVLVAIGNSYSNEGFPSRLPDILDIYGKPDVVTWGFNYWHRSLIWLDLGMLIEIDLEYNENSQVYLFPPIEEAEFEESWLNKILPKSIEGLGDPELIDEIGRLPSRYEKEDPWGLTDWWRIND